jgi:hypothetical protein
MIKAHIAEGHETIMHMPLRMKESNRNRQDNIKHKGGHDNIKLMTHRMVHKLYIVMFTWDVVFYPMCPILFILSIRNAANNPLCDMLLIVMSIQVVFCNRMCHRR